MNARGARNQNVVASLAAFMPAGAEHPASPDSAADGGDRGDSALSVPPTPPPQTVTPDVEQQIA